MVQLIPLYVCTALGCGGAVFYLLRLAIRNPDVSWNKRTNPEPWQEYRDKQYKVYFFLLNSPFIPSLCTAEILNSRQLSLLAETLDRLKL